MSVLDFDIRDYTDPNRILEESLAPRPPVTVDNTTGQTWPNTFMGQPVNLQPGEPGYQPAQPSNPFGTKSPLQPIQVPERAGRFPEVTVPQREKINLDEIPSAPSVMGSEDTTVPAVIKPMEGVTNEDRIHAMAMVLGAVGQNNFSNVLNAAQTGLMEKEINAKKHNDALTRLTRADYSVGKDGKVSYVPARYEIDSDGNYALRSEDVRAKEARKWAAANPSLDHPGGATGQREDAYIGRYYRLSEEEQLEQAREQGVYGRPLYEFELIDRHMKNSIGFKLDATTGKRIYHAMG